MGRKLLHSLLGHWPWWHHYDHLGGQFRQRVCNFCGRRQRRLVLYDPWGKVTLDEWVNR